MKAVELDNKYNGLPVQVRVVQNKEPDHFLLVFKGKMVVHSGGRASSFKNRMDQDSYDVDGTRLFHVRGTNEFDTRAVQVEEKASSLNSNDCFVLETPDCTYIWYGKVKQRIWKIFSAKIMCAHINRVAVVMSVIWLATSWKSYLQVDILKKLWKEGSHKSSGMLWEARPSMAQASGYRKLSPHTHHDSSSVPMPLEGLMLRRSLILPRM